MRALVSLLLVLLVCLANPGCVDVQARNNELMQSWMGCQESQLIAAWGPPPNVRDDGKGGHVLVYGNFNGAYRMFYVDSSGVIYSWRWRGL
jgi:hypothetical protein